MNKYLLILLGLITSFSVNAQFDDDVPKVVLYDNAKDMEVYTQMVAKDKLYLIYNLQKEQASKELDYAMAVISENLSNIDLNETNPQIVQKLRKIKEVWIKLNAKLTQNLTPKEFTNLFFEVNTYERLISDLVAKMREVYNLPDEKIGKYDDIQNLRIAIQKINLSYYANYLGLSKSFMHEYQKNISHVNQFIKEKSNLFLNDPMAEKLFADVIIDWNFLRANLFSKQAKNPRTVFSLVTAIDFKLKSIKELYIESLTKDF